MKKQDLTTITKERLQAYINSGQTVLVAVSGGVDSVSLLHVMQQLAKLNRWQLVIGHVNHGLRLEANDDEALVAKYADSFGLPLYIKRVNVRAQLGSQGGAMEEKARELRYAALRDMAQSQGARYIVTAHTADDQVETVLFNFLRGAGLRGLGGMKEKSEDILRPWLSVTKAQVLAYAKKHRLKYYQDQSNLDVKLTRNRIRHQLVPLLETYNQNFSSQVLEAAQVMQQAEGVVGEVASRHLDQMAQFYPDRAVLSLSRFRELDDFMRVEVLKVVLRRLGADLDGLAQAHYRQLFALIGSSGRVAKRKIGGKLFLAKSYDKITVSKN